MDFDPVSYLMGAKSAGAGSTAAKVTAVDLETNSSVSIQINTGLIMVARYANSQYVTRVMFEVINGGNPLLLMDAGTQTGKVTATKQSDGVVKLSSTMSVTVNCVVIGT